MENHTQELIAVVEKIYWVIFPTVMTGKVGGHPHRTEIPNPLGTGKPLVEQLVYLIDHLITSPSSEERKLLALRVAEDLYWSLLEESTPLD